MVFIAVSPVESYFIADNMAVSSPMYQDERMALDNQAEAMGEVGPNERLDEPAPEQIVLDGQVEEDASMGEGENQPEEFNEGLDELAPEITNQERTWEDWEDDNEMETSQVNAEGEANPEGEGLDHEMTDVPIMQAQSSEEKPLDDDITAGEPELHTTKDTDITHTQENLQSGEDTEVSPEAGPQTSADAE